MDTKRMAEWEMADWLEARGEQDDLLYERHGRSLEIGHTGEFVAIADDGRTLVGSDQLSVAQLALAQFGRGGFALRRIGAPAEMSWRDLR